MGVVVEQGREDVVMQIRDYVLGTSHKPLVLHGLSGCGKTSLMAKAASQVRHYTGTVVAKAASQVRHYTGTVVAKAASHVRHYTGTVVAKAASQVRHYTGKNLTVQSWPRQPAR